VLLCACNPFTVNSNYWQASQEDGGQILPQDDSQMQKVLRFKYASRNVTGLGEKDEELDKTLKF